MDGLQETFHSICLKIIEGDLGQCSRFPKELRSEVVFSMSNLMTYTVGSISNVWLEHLSVGLGKPISLVSNTFCHFALNAKEGG